MLKIALSLTLSLYIFAEGVVVPDDYLISNDKELSFVYSKEYAPILPELKAYQQNVINQYEKEFGFKLDEKLWVGLASMNNQIANGFSTQIPFNSQLFYGAGAGDIDYFCFNSWLKTLIIHETAHNFQLNAKEGKMAWLSHKVVGNTPITFLGLFPFFPIPNIFESSFLLEGNAVMNESRFDNGGRLYSGYALAELVTLARTGKVTAELMYNETLEFPYGEKFYLIGGFFQQFLVEKYGVKKVNHYFKLHSTQLFPFFTSSAFRNLFGKTFKTLLAEFVTEVNMKHASFRPTQGKKIATSQQFTPMNILDDEIYTLISDAKSSPKILQYSRSKREINYQEGAWNFGEPFKLDGEYYTQSSSKTSPTKITMGLFDKDSYLKNGTESKVIQGYLPDGRAVYFDVERSLEKPHIFIAGEFYDQSNSSVHVDTKGNLYYFKQEEKTRTLYKNKKAIFDYQGHYGFVTDIGEQGEIYFISATKNGSGAYRYGGENIEQVTASDDVIDIKLINNSEALVTTIGSEGYSYQVTKMQPKTAQVASFSYAIEDKNSKVTASSQLFKPSSSQLKSKEYHPLTQLQYSSLDQYMGYGSDNGFTINLGVNYSDPLMQNSLLATLFYDDKRTIGGIGYYNQAHQLEFGGMLYGVEHSSEYKGENERDYGYSTELKLPSLATGYWYGSSSLEYTKKYDSQREPLSFSIDISNNRWFGLSKYPNHLNALNLFLSDDREDSTIGASYHWIHDMPWQSFIGLSGTYMKSEDVDTRLQKGIEIDDNRGDIKSDYSSITMPTLDKQLYAKEVKVAEISLSKTIDTPLYFFSFPISLHRETLYLKQKYYDIELLNESRQYNQSTIGLESDILFLNSFTLPIKFEWIYNQDTKDNSLFRVMVGEEF